MSDDFLRIKNSLPVLGVGTGLRRELAADTFSCSADIDWLEIVAENYMDLGGLPRERLNRALDSFSLVTHGVNLSIGSTDSLRNDYLIGTKKLLEKIDAPWWSDHLCFTSVASRYLHDLLPLPFSREAAKHVAARAKAAQSFVGRPLLLENISYYMSMPGSEMTEAQFLGEVLEQADCGLLLDVNNVYVNSINHNFDPYKFIDSIPLERTVQIHVAGHGHGEEMIIDTHGAPVIEPVFELLEYVLNRVDVKAVMLERDQNYPEFAEILSELKKIREIASRCQPLLATPPHRQRSTDCADSCRAAHTGEQLAYSNGKAGNRDARSA